VNGFESTVRVRIRVRVRVDLHDTDACLSNFQRRKRGHVFERYFPKSTLTFQVFNISIFQDFKIARFQDLLLLLLLL